MKCVGMITIVKRAAGVLAVLLGSVLFVMVGRLVLMWLWMWLLDWVAPLFIIGLGGMVISGLIGRDFWGKGVLPALLTWGGFMLFTFLAFASKMWLANLLLFIYWGVVAVITLALAFFAACWRWRAFNTLLPWHLQLLITLSVLMIAFERGMAC
jgi:hypothetical protein